MDTTAIIGVAGIVGTASAPAIAGWLNIVRLRAESNEARVVEVRKVLDDAGRLITETISSLDHYRASLMRNEAGNETAAALASVTDHLGKLWRVENRMALRLGTTAPAFAAFLKASEMLGQYRVRLTLAAADRDSGVRPEWPGQELRDDAMRLQTDFFNEAARIIGPSEPRPSRLSWRRREPPALSSAE